MGTSSSTATSAVPATRERLLDAAARLFYTDGVSVGVDALCQAAGVSKKSMYQLFGSKEDLLAAALRRSVPGYLAALIPPDPNSMTGLDRILTLFDRLETIVADPAFQGCPYLSVATEIKLPHHPARNVAREFHDTLTEYFRVAADDAGADEPLLLAQQLTMIHDGIAARAVVQGQPTPGLALRTAKALLEVASVRVEERAS
jgi:AcrR family transcriptional regulator